MLSALRVKMQDGFTPKYLKIPVPPPIIIFLAPEVKMTSTVLNAELTLT